VSQPLPVAGGVWQLRTVLVNLFFVRLEEGWMLIDAGIAGASGPIRAAASALFGSTPPRAIVLTHGHFDHVGSLRDLLDTWDVPVYAHPFELPYLTGREPYPAPDPTVGGGLLAWSSFLYPRGPYDFGARVLALPPDGRLPFAPEWSAIHTPGHSRGHVSLYRDRDGLLIAGDAVTTTQQESLWSVLTQRCDLNGPPAYFTPDWEASKRSVRQLAALRLETLATGHGQPMRGEAMRQDLRDLAARFDERARPAHGRYVTGRDGAPARRKFGWWPIGIAAGVAAAVLAVYVNGRLGCRTAVAAEE
jgi:glyoxylase-like metal-dependent hydrolase (beta-lactamase superfamily II)